ncbi:hypothetical protein TVAG_398780 [Trichomonas vaginalis G3]|uniref:Uncharacterized protein n=1 Tax=Trichomonas vaginalis (strain ATCC PRA-98 / G3) TaxID=412133 RepID=A2EVG7_TRIV3|nr:hypothetical protein TVAGG3_0526700 [Trichomonas vaginalis G3]EAY03353.1 hypothetical protein TVAG_398780 [Trichomonas vaginalis G3]KAI5518828.1 hypothetical protein TVAGG3_0526700 [Trichomonas vaginalis G3]|eukprot:XP_001315576.1 hypothetical protein [Trichomonas vaginalis G3]
MDFTIENTLQQIMAKAKENPENEKKVYQSLESLLRYLQDIFFETTIEPPNQSSSNTVEPKKITKKLVNYDDKEKAKEFLEEISHRYSHSFSQPELVKFATSIGPKHGIFISRDQKRNKVLITLWLKSHFEILEQELGEYASTLQKIEEPALIAGK